MPEVVCGAVRIGVTEAVCGAAGVAVPETGCAVITGCCGAETVCGRGLVAGDGACGCDAGETGDDGIGVGGTGAVVTDCPIGAAAMDAAA